MKIMFSTTTTPGASQQDLVVDQISIEAEDYAAGVEELRARLAPDQAVLSVRVER